MSKAAQNNQRPVIAASEVAEFVFCAKAWQLKRQSVIAQSPQLGSGKAFHKRHGAEVTLAWRLHRIGASCAWIVIALLIAMAVMRNIGFGMR